MALDSSTSHISTIASRVGQGMISSNSNHLRGLCFEAMRLVRLAVSVASSKCIVTRLYLKSSRVTMRVYVLYAAALRTVTARIVDVVAVAICVSMQTQCVAGDANLTEFLVWEPMLE